MRGRRNRVIDKLGDIAVRVGAGGGFILGAAVGLQGTPRAAGCPAGEVCVGEQFLATIWPVLGPAVAGAAAGLAASLMFVVLLRRLRPRGLKSSRPLGRWISARYAGRCRCCSGTVVPGDQVIWDAADRAVICAGCVG